VQPYGSPWDAIRNFENTLPKVPDSKLPNRGRYSRNVILASLQTPKDVRIRIIR
jgi:hypothetical protein